MSRSRDFQMPRRNGRSGDQPSGPRRVRGGIKLRAPENDVCALADEKSRFVVDGWLALMRRSFDEHTLEEGLEYALSGQVVSLDLRRARIEAVVQGRVPRPYPVRLDVPELAEGQWRTLIDRMAEEAVYTASLLAGELPASLNELAQPSGVTLVPGDEERLTGSTDLGRQRGTQRNTKHAAAVAHLMAERLARDPMLIFALRGLPVERLLDRLRERRAIRTRGEATAHADPLIPQSMQTVMPLEACIDEYWGSGSQLAAIEQSPPLRYAPQAILRRLGPSPLGGKFPLVGLLASIYEAVGNAAVEVRNRAEGVNGESDSGAGSEDADETFVEG